MMKKEGDFHEERPTASGCREQRRRDRPSPSPYAQEYVDEDDPGDRDPLEEMDWFRQPRKVPKVVDDETALEVFET